MRTLRLTFCACAALLFVTFAGSSDADASSRSTCYFEVKITKAPNAKGVATFQLLRLGKQRSIGTLCSYLLKKPPTVTAELHTKDVQARGALKVGATTTLRLEAASWCSGPPQNKCGSSRRYHLVATAAPMTTTASGRPAPPPTMSTPARPGPAMSRPAAATGSSQPQKDSGCATGGSSEGLPLTVLILAALLFGWRRPRA